MKLWGGGGWVKYHLSADTRPTGISEYFFFFLAVSGLFLLRRKSHSPSRYRTWTLNPGTFCLVSGFLVVRGVLTDPPQGIVLCTLMVIGWLILRRRVPRQR